jgi:hypothetical protein
MARSHVSNLSPKVLGASGTFTFQPTELPFPALGRGISEFLIGITDSNGFTTRSTGILNNISRVRVRAGGVPILDLSAYELGEFITQIGPSDSGAGTGATSPALIGGAYGLKNAVTFRLPMNLADAVSEDEQDLCQFPLGMNPQIEVITTASMTSSSFMQVVTTLTDIKPQFRPKLIGQAMNVPSGATSFRVPITEDGLIRALGLCTQSDDIGSTVWTAANAFKRYRVVLSGVEKFNITPLMLFERERNRSGWTGDVAATTTTIPALVYAKMVGMLRGPAGHSFIEVDAGTYASGTFTNAAMGTPSASTEYVVWSLEDQ